MLSFDGRGIVRVGVPLFEKREGEEPGPRDLLGEEPRFVLIGDRDRGGISILPLREPLNTSVGSGIVPGTEKNQQNPPPLI